MVEWFRKGNPGAGPAAMTGIAAHVIDNQFLDSDLSSRREHLVKNLQMITGTKICKETVIHLLKKGGLSVAIMESEELGLVNDMDVINDMVNRSPAVTLIQSCRARS